MNDIAPFLLVEDDPDDSLLIRRAFERANLVNPVHAVADGEAAIRYLSDALGLADSRPLPAVMLLDLRLPRRSGLDVLEWVRQHPQLSGLPVVVLTASNAAEDWSRAFELRANGYLVKPVEFDALIELVRRLRLSWAILSESSVG